MRRIDLQEYGKSGPHRLTVEERDALRAALPHLTIEPAPGKEGKYLLRPGSHVGAVETGGLSVLIHPKIGIPQLLSLACYAIEKITFRTEEFDFPDDPALPDVLARALAEQARRAFSRGLLHGYRAEEEALLTVRGRIRFDEQLRRRFGIPVPIEVRYDEFTDDVLANRLVKAAAARLRGMRLSSKSRSGLGWTTAMLDNVTLADFPPDAVPEVAFDRLNEHYRTVVGLSRLILRHSAFESRRGAVRASGFLMDMNMVFQEFVTCALREALGVSDRVFGEREIPTLDAGERLKLRPDLTWWDGSSCVFVGDAKYKNISGEPVPISDLCQLLAYVSALDLPGGLLVYAAGEATGGVYEVRHSGKRLEVAALDLSGAFDVVLEQVRGLAEKVRALRERGRAGHLAAV